MFFLISVISGMDLGSMAAASFEIKLSLGVTIEDGKV